MIKDDDQQANEKPHQENLLMPTLTKKIQPVKVRGIPPRAKNQHIKKVKKAGISEHDQGEGNKGKVKAQREKARTPGDKLRL
ncbi:hypothetical protein Tco_0657201 [Tanacetum coccineum]|uniref:Uncharacterized protein n=1 Tax=Tanacetum coccineum TaxID=301880 RepID=A0ABQ4XAX2_9ASTR